MPWGRSAPTPWRRNPCCWTSWATAIAIWRWSALGPWRSIDPAPAEIAAKTVPVLIEGLALPLPQCRLSAAEALDRLGPLAKDAAPALQKASTDVDEAVRDEAAKALTAVQQPAPKPESGAAKLIARGDLVVTLEPDVAMMSEKTVVAKLPKATQLKVLEVRAPWVAVQATIEGKPTTGWVLQTQIAKP